MTTTSSVLAGSVLEREIELETKAIQDGVVRYRHMVNEATRRGEASTLKPAERLLAHWYDVFAWSVNEHKRAVMAGEAGRHYARVRPVFDEIDCESIAVIVMHEAVSACILEPSGCSYVKLVHAIGAAVVAEINTRILKETGRWDEFTKRYRVYNERRLNAWTKKNVDESMKDRRGALLLGSVLLDTLIETAADNDYGEKFSPAFVRDTKHRGKRTTYKLRLSDAALALIDDGHRQRQFLRPKYLPMVVRPYQLSKESQNQYVKVRAPLVAKLRKEQKKPLREADLSTTWASIYALSGTPWRVNADVLRVQRLVWESGGGAVGIPHRDDKPFGEKPHDFDDNFEARDGWKLEAARTHRENVMRASRRAEYHMGQAVVDLFEGEPEWYLPHYVDFRGRGYPIPTHLNHHGNDVYRGIMEFARPAEVVGDAVDWLLIHAANCAGHDKLTYAERVEWTSDHLGQVADTVRDPMDSTWWMEQENPWQFLAACYAIVDPARGAHLPVQLDGTCNGLQHFAALGRDSRGAAAVNMVPGDRPSDIYTLVSVEVARRVNDDDSDIARRVASLVGRKVVKQTVMTTPYGVTEVGARGQVRNRLRELGLEGKELSAASRYLSKVVTDAVGEVCVGARDIMAWLRECGGKFCDAGVPIAWTTPIGFPAVQHYVNMRRWQVRTSSAKIQLHIPDGENPTPKRKKQVQSFPPNYIHSIDAAHMHLTAIACAEAGIEFAEVHDSYWTHAATTTRLGEMVRERFVYLHETAGLGTLLEEMRRRLPDAKFPEPPDLGDYDVNNVKKSPYFFS
jgi:DNA-directed RNA polymerase